MANNMGTNPQIKKSGWDKICEAYASHSAVVNMVYSLGASIVIIGAMFKILHLPFASYILGAGMVTEAFLFFIGIFEKPHATYHWENVYPQLLGNETVNASGTGLSGASALSDLQVKELQQGIEKLGKAATQLSTLGDVATASNGLVEKMQAAGKATESFVGTQDKLVVATQGLAQQYQTIQGDITTVGEHTKQYAQNVTAINAQLASLNSAYELQLKDVQAQVSASQVYTTKLQAIDATLDTVATQTHQLQQVTTASAEAAAHYLAGQKKLAEQVADLNKIYGNMLNAL